MPTTCGINVNMSLLKGQLTTSVDGFLNLKGSLGTPGGLGALSGVVSVSYTHLTLPTKA